MPGLWNEERRVSEEALSDEQLAAWWAAVERAENPDRRALHKFILLSRHRPTAIKEARWEHFGVRRRVLGIPNPKGGEKRAFDMPLSRPMLRVLNEAKRAGRVLHPDHAAEWIFPCAKGHVVEHKQNLLPATHKALRHTYYERMQVLGVSTLFRKLLMGHKVADVTDGYGSGEALAGTLIREQERISKALQEARKPNGLR